VEELCWKMVILRVAPLSKHLLSNITLLTLVRNRGELAEGWYDPLTLQKAIASSAEQESDPRDQDVRRQPLGRPSRAPIVTKAFRDDSRDPDSDTDDSIGPTLPGQEGGPRGRRAGPSIPNMQDLELKRGSNILDRWA
jgi:hypothetical protein